MDQEIPIDEWVDTLAIEADGRIWAFEGGCWWDGKNWIPIDDFDGLRYERVGDIGYTIPPEIAKQMKFTIEVRQTKGDEVGSL